MAWTIRELNEAKELIAIADETVSSVAKLLNRTKSSVSHALKRAEVELKCHNKNRQRRLMRKRKRMYYAAHKERLRKVNAERMRKSRGKRDE